MGWYLCSPICLNGVDKDRENITLMVWTGTTLPSPGSRCKFSIGVGAHMKYLNTASCVESLWIMNGGWNLSLNAESSSLLS